MNDVINDLVRNQSELSWQQIAGNILVAAAIGFLIYLSYYISHRGTIYSKKFNASLVILTVLTGTVMTVIGNNIALSLGMVGALSIVRFRTAIKDTRDTVYIFWTIIAGICCGVGDYIVAAVGSSVVFCLLIFLGLIKNDNRMLLIIRAARSTESRIQATIFKMFNRKAIMRVKNTTEETVEFIYEITSRALEKAEKTGTGVSDAIYAIGNIEYMNIVVQNDEVSS